MHSSSLARVLAAAALGSCAWLSGADARAHITLLEPASWVVENGTGDPQKTGPCGGNGTPTGAITEYQAGETITVRWRETIAHPGHFRISFAENRRDFVDPLVTSNANQISISAAIMDPPVLPVLKDNISPRASVSGAGTEFSEQITLPDEPCEKCTLQVIQFMAEHAPGYFYYHCADIRILAADGEGAGGSGAGGTASTGAGSGGTASAGSAGSSSEPDPVSSDEDEDSGCSIARGAPHAGDSLAAALLLGVGAELYRRRARRCSPGVRRVTAPDPLSSADVSPA
jgi:hypothetical protein